MLLLSTLATRNFASEFLVENNSTTISVGFKTEKPYVPLDVTRGDLLLGSIVLGFFFGFLVAVVWTAVCETKRTKKFSLYTFMIWLEIVADIVFAVVTWLYLAGYLAPGLGVFATIIACWTCQVQCLLHIIANRLSILISKPIHRTYLKLSVGLLVGCISIVTACIWIPTQLQINHMFIETNHWWDRFEKAVYLVTDLALNWLFIYTVKRRLVDHGLRKYDKILRFNEYMIVVSISMDVLLIVATTFRNPFIYCQFHPVAYIVKLQIEMIMSQLIVKVARSTGIHIIDTECTTSENEVSQTATGSQLPTFHVSSHVHGTDEEIFTEERKLDKDLKLQSDGSASDVSVEDECRRDSMV